MKIGALQKKDRVLAKLEKWQELERVRNKISESKIPYYEIKKHSKYFAAMLYVNYSNFRSSLKAIKDLEDYVDNWVKNNS